MAASKYVCTLLVIVACSAKSAAAPTFMQTNLVSDVPGLAKITDPNLKNPWAMALGTNSGIWIANNKTGKATTYDGTGQAIPTNAPLVVTIPAPGKNGGTSAPTGVTANASDGFLISAGGSSAPSTQLFATEDGTIAGWNAKVNASTAVIVVDNSSSGAIYKGLAMGFNSSGALLFATDFHNGNVDVFDSKFQPVRKAGMFRDPQLPSGYAPFGIAAINGAIYVTYALQDADKEDDVRGAGNGFIDVFDTDGKLQKRLVSQGQLNSPWGMAWAALQGLGTFNNALFVGNFGDGSISVFDFDSGQFLGKVSDASETPVRISGIWGLQFGLGVAQGSSSTLYFTAGVGNEEHGLFGSLTVIPPSRTSSPGPSMVDESLRVATVISGLNQPSGIAFLGDADFLVTEKASGKVQHVVNGGVLNTALDLNVNSASERGLLGITLQPGFAANRGVYLYWTESLTSADTTDLAQVPLLGNRVDRYIWNPATATLTFDKNIIKLRSFQADANQPMRGNHDGGKILFGPDGKLYIQIGDQGRRGQLQNIAAGPFSGKNDDDFGGPAPDNSHLTGVILRLNPDGSTPADNPFFKVTSQDMATLEKSAGVTLTSDQLDEVVANVHKIFSYGRRNGFGLAFDPQTGLLWESENGDDAFDEINQINAGANGGWIQIMGPLNRVADFKEIETSFTALQGNLPVAGNVPFSAIDPATFLPALQQVRWPPTLLADSPGEAMNRLFVIPGSHYEGPEFSWKWAVAPAAIGFAGSALGPRHAGHMFVGASRTFLEEGFLYEFAFDNSRRHLALDNPKLKDGVDDNDYKFDEGESGDLIAGKNFGVVTDITTGPDGRLYIVSLSNGAVYMIR